LRQFGYFEELGRQIDFWWQGIGPGGVGYDLARGRGGQTDQRREGEQEAPLDAAPKPRVGGRAQIR